MRHVAVIDIGKTNAKVALVDLDSMREIAVRTRPNAVLPGPPYPHFDIEGLWAFILDGLAALQVETPIDAISVTTHGATAALLDASGDLALPVLDYEFDGLNSVSEAYDHARPPFAETGTPRLSVGLNLGAQIFWQSKTFADDFRRVSSILMYPQYWAYRLTGMLANEVTSLGCHTDLWNPNAKSFSSLVDAQGWTRLMAPVRPASDSLRPILPELSARTGIAPGTPVICGIHDSNASLLPHLFRRSPPFSVVSTGTWVISMAVGGKTTALDPTRDTLVNVNASGDPVRSARFMGGREHSVLSSGHDMTWSDADVATVLQRSILLLPSVQTGSGPFPDRAMAWQIDSVMISDEPEDGPRSVAISFYLALMTATCLDLIGGDGSSVVEGPFARNSLFLRMLASATGRPVIAGSEAATGTSIGAAMLAAPGQAGPGKPDQAAIQPNPEWSRYASKWRQAVAAG